MTTPVIVRRGLGLVPEGRRIFTRLSVRENLQLAMSARLGDVDRGAEVARALSIFPDLRPLIGAPAGRLSGGEQQQLAIARCLVSAPRLLLLDEPSLGLAPLVVTKIFALIRRLSDDGVPILLVDQNARVVAKLADRVYVMRAGRIVDELTGKGRSNERRLFRGYFGMPHDATVGAP
jgi:branched-chain amino acid transport system ATP-binding protein